MLTIDLPDSLFLKSILDSVFKLVPPNISGQITSGSIRFWETKNGCFYDSNYHIHVMILEDNILKIFYMTPFKKPPQMRDSFKNSGIIDSWEFNLNDPDVDVVQIVVQKIKRLLK